MKKIFLLAVFIYICGATRAQQEVIYHVFQRSFFDSNNDLHGDLKGIEQKLDYLQELGVTSILLTPLYASEFYHNYFATDFGKIDPEYGTMHEYLSLVKEIHKRGMKIYQDVEMQYVTHEHPWFVDSFEKPNSRFGKYVYYLDAENKQPFWFYNVPEFTTYNNLKQKIAVVNMNNSEVRDYTFKVLAFWVDPNSDGKFDDGVDGFRFDHMMDDLDNFHKLPNLFENFWRPVVTSLKQLNPAIVITAEQANWFSLGREYFRDAMVDRVFAFGLSWAIETLDKKKLTEAADSILRGNPPGKQQIVFIENHDTRRMASVKGMTVEKLKIAGTLNLLLGGVPLLYYGQELGIKGKQMKGQTDGNDIPIREAFEWYSKGEGEGTAVWYKDTGPWWDSTNIKPNDGISFEEQHHDQGSLWNHYRRMIKIKKTYPAFYQGDYHVVTNDNAQVFSFLRAFWNEKIVVIVNLSPQNQRTSLMVPVAVVSKSAKSLMDKSVLKLSGDRLTVALPSYGIQIYKFD